MNDMDMYVEIGGGRAIQDSHIGSLPLKTCFQNHISLMSSIGESKVLTSLES